MYVQMAGMLQALGKKLTNARMVQGQMERILHARVPIIKFKHSATGQMFSLQLPPYMCSPDFPLRPMLFTHHSALESLEPHVHAHSELSQVVHVCSRCVALNCMLLWSD